MKRRFFVILLSLISIVCLAFAITACASNDKEADNEGTEEPVVCEHDYSVWQVGLAPTCTSIGYEMRKCTLCGNTEYIFQNAIGHSPDEGRVIVSPTCKESGYKVYLCTVCNATESEIIPKTEHDFVDNECTVCGELKLSEGIQYGLYGGVGENEYAGIQSIGTCTDKRVVIADTYNGRPVRIINYRAFANSAITSVVFPETLTYIGYNAFENCVQLEEVILPDSVATIGDEAFSECSNLHSITIGKELNYVGWNSFSHCSSLENVYISDMAAYCGIDFRGASASPMHYAKNLYLNGEFVRDLIIPEGVIKIGCSAFYNAICLRSVTFPSSLKEFNGWTFSDCVNLEAVYIDSVVHWVGLQFGNVSDNPLYQNRLGKSSYLYVDGQPMTDLFIPEGVTSIGSYAFVYYDKLTSITLPSSLTVIDRWAFAGCFQMEGVYISDLTAWCNISFASHYENPLFWANNLYLNGQLITDLVIPEGIRAIDHYAFARGSFTSITIPDSVTIIRSTAFLFCNDLERVFYGGTAEQWEEVRGNDTVFASVDIYFYREQEPPMNSDGTAYDGNFWHYENGKAVIWSKKDS